MMYKWARLSPDDEGCLRTTITGIDAWISNLKFAQIEELEMFLSVDLFFSLTFFLRDLSKIKLPWLIEDQRSVFVALANKESKSNSIPFLYLTSHSFDSPFERCQVLEHLLSSNEYSVSLAATSIRTTTSSPSVLRIPRYTNIQSSKSTATKEQELAATIHIRLILVVICSTTICSLDLLGEEEQPGSPS